MRPACFSRQSSMSSGVSHRSLRPRHAAISLSVRIRSRAMTASPRRTSMVNERIPFDL